MEWRTGDPPEVYLCGVCEKDHDLSKPCYWWEREENHVGNLKHKHTNGMRIKIYWRSRFPDDDTYALITEDGKIICFLWLGEIVDPGDDREYFLED
jgi:hypothetical protein